MNSYITIDKIDTINAELSNYCNAACPMCARFDSEQNLVKDITNNAHTTLEEIRDKIGKRVIKNLRNFYSCGNLGDGSMNPQCIEIYEHVKSCNKNTSLSLNTNGGARDKEFWKDLAKLGVAVTFSIDGLEDTNHLYRRRVKWDKLMENIESFISAGGEAHWDFLVFKHNQHQLEQAKEMSKTMGFKSFRKKATTRWNDFDKDGNWLQRDSISIDGYKLAKANDDNVADVDNSRDVKNKEVKLTRILCKSFHNKIEIFLHANGNVSPCCWLGDLNIHESKNIIKDYKSVNIRHTELEEILNGHYFQEIWKGINGMPQEHRLQTCQQVCGANV